MTRKAKPKLSGEERTKNMKHVFNVLVCPHSWGDKRAVRVVDPDGAHAPFDGMLSVCAVCGTKRVDRGDGTSSMFPSDGLSASPVPA